MISASAPKSKKAISESTVRGQQIGITLKSEIIEIIDINFSLIWILNSKYDNNWVDWSRSKAAWFALCPVLKSRPVYTKGP